MCHISFWLKLDVYNLILVVYVPYVALYMLLNEIHGSGEPQSSLDTAISVADTVSCIVFSTDPFGTVEAFPFLRRAVLPARKFERALWLVSTGWRPVSPR